MLFLQVVELLHHRGLLWSHGNFRGFCLLESVDIYGKLIIVTIICGSLIAVLLREVLRAIVTVTILELDGESCLGTIRLQTDELSAEILYLLTDRILCKQGFLFHRRLFLHFTGEDMRHHTIHHCLYRVSRIVTGTEHTLQLHTQLCLNAFTRLPVWCLGVIVNAHGNSQSDIVKFHVGINNGSLGPQQSTIEILLRKTFAIITLLNSEIISNP